MKTRLNILVVFTILLNLLTANSFAQITVQTGKLSYTGTDKDCKQFVSTINTLETTDPRYKAIIDYLQTDEYAKLPEQEKKIATTTMMQMVTTERDNIALNGTLGKQFDAYLDVIRAENSKVQATRLAKENPEKYLERKKAEGGLNSNSKDVDVDLSEFDVDNSDLDKALTEENQKQEKNKQTINNQDSEYANEKETGKKLDVTIETEKAAREKAEAGIKQVWAAKGYRNITIEYTKTGTIVKDAATGKVLK